MKKANAFQSMLWTFQELYPSSPAYNLAYDLSSSRAEASREAQKIEKIKTALTSAIGKYPLAQAKFTYEESLSVHIDVHHTGWSFQEFDDEIKNEARLEKESRRLASIPFDLHKAQWIKVYLLKTKDKLHFLFITHHLIWDGACFALFLNDLINAITGKEARGPALIPGPLDYLDYHSASIVKSSEVFAVPDENDFALDFTRPKVSKHTGDRVQFNFSEKLTQDFLEVATKLQITPYQLTLAYTLAWTAQATRNPNPSLVSPFSNRSTTRSRFMKGPLVGLGRSSATITSSTTWSDLLEDVKSSFSLAKKEALDAARGLTAFPKSSSILTFQNQFNEKIEIPDFEDLHLTSFVPYSSKSDLEWVIHSHPSKKSWNGWLEFDSEIFTMETAGHFVESWLHGISELTKKVDLKSEKVKDLSFLPLAHAETLRSWNALTKTHSHTDTLASLFEKQASATPHACALIYFKDNEERSLSYEELNKKAETLASRILSETSNKPGNIGVSFYRSAELVIAILATIKAGGAYVPFDPDLPESRRQEMMEECSPSLILSPSTEFSRDERNGKKPSISVHDPAYIIFTSGSTGKPKGAMNSHGAIVNRLKWHQKEYQLHMGERVLQKTPYTFDVSVWEFFWPLIEGGTLVMSPPESHKDPKALAEIILNQKINVLHFVPSMLEAFLDEASFLNRQFPSLKKVLCSGESLSRSTTQRFFKILPGIELHNLYGPTECAVDVTAVQIRPQDHGVISIGKPIDNTQIYIVNSELSPLPLGWQGEIIIGGTAVGMGYVARPELTDEKFIHSHLWGRIYRTGDLGKFLPNGEIQYLGRIDQQVKWHGFRIELEEIEARLSIINFSVRSKVRLRNQEALVAYLKLSPDLTEEDALKLKDSLKMSLSNVLPDYMVPNEWRRLVDFPVSGHGKSESMHLDEVSARIERALLVSNSPTYEKFTPLEGLLIPIWEEVLQRFPVSPSSSFFELSGDSLKILRIKSKLRPFGFDFSIPAFMLEPNLKGMAILLKRDLKTEETGLESYTPSVDEQAWIPAESIAYPARELELALAYIEESRSVTHPGTYHDIFHLRIPSALDQFELEKRWRKLTGVHPILRATLHLEAPEKPLWLVSKEACQSWHVMPAEADSQKWISDLIERKIHPLDLKLGPLVRMFFKSTLSRETELILSFHHAALDGWSASVLITSLLSDQDIIAASTKDLKNLVSSWFKEQKSLQSNKSNLYWKKKLESVSPTLLEPISRDQVLVETHWSKSELQALHVLCGKNSLSLKSLLLAVHLRALQMITHAENVTTGVIANGRDVDLGVDTLGLYLLTLPYSTSHTGGLIALAREIQLGDQEVEAHKHFPLTKVIQASGFERIFNTAFNFTQFERYDALIKQDNSSFSFTAYENTEFALLCNWHVQAAQEYPMSIRLAIQWGDGKFSPEFLLSVYQDLIDGLIEKSIPLQLPFENRPDHSAPSILSRWRQFSDSPAVFFNDGEFSRSLSYYELSVMVDLWKNQIQLLKATTASIELPRTPEALAILLALSELSISIIPIDQTLPIGRQNEMLAQSSPNIRLVLKDSVISIEKNTDQRQGTSFYTLFTSGSTGKPKGIEMGRAAFERLIDWQLSSEPRAMRTLQFASWSFDISFQEIFTTLCSGGCLLMPSDKLRKDIFEVNRWIHGMEVERIFLPFVLLNHFCHSSLSENLIHKNLKVVITAGEQLEVTPGIIEFFKSHPETKLFNQYGPTESHVVTESRVDPRDEKTPMLPPIGAPVWGTSLTVVNGFLEDNPIVKDGLPGELWIGGSCLANGYLVPSSQWIERNGRRWYKSGDLVRNIGSKEVSLQYLGRIDNQVKINGQRIELLEIEAQLSEAAKLLGFLPEQATAWIIPDQKILVAGLIYPTTILEADLEERLINALESTLPHAMIPARIFFLKTHELPLTSNGKVDRLKLGQISKEWMSPRSKDPSKKSMALTSFEKDILKIWEIILARPLRDQISSSEEAHFGKLGGNSLSYLRLVAQLSKSAGRKLKLEDLLRRPTLAKQARWLQGEGLDSRRKLPETCIELFRPIRMPKATLVIIHPIGGSIQCYEALVNVLKSNFREKDIRMIGIQSPRTPTNSIPNLSAGYIADLKSAGILIEGHPLSLMGWSFGGVVAVEMAAQLEIQGLKIASLSLLDSIALKEKLQTSIALKTQVEWFFWELLGMFQSYPMELESSIISITEAMPDPQTIDEALKILHLYLDKAREFNFKVEIESSEIKHFFMTFNSNLEGLQTYTPNKISTELNLFRCQEQLPTRLKSVHQFVGTQFDDPSHGWQRFCELPVQIHFVGGDHVTLIQKPHVENLGQIWMRMMKVC